MHYISQPCLSEPDWCSFEQHFMPFGVLFRWFPTANVGLFLITSKFFMENRRKIAEIFALMSFHTNLHTHLHTQVNVLLISKYIIKCVCKIINIEINLIES